MNMKKPLIVALCLGMSACHTVSGTLSVTSGNLQLKDKKGNLVTIPEGNANVVMESGKLLLKARNTAGKKDTIELDAIKNLLPQFQSAGEHKFLASETGQPVDIDEITLNTNTESREHEDWESCTTTITVEVPCPTPTPNPSASPAGGGGDHNPPAGGNGNGGDHNPPQGGNGNGGDHNPPQGGNGGGHNGPGNGGGHGPGHAKVVDFKATRRPAGQGCTASRVVTGRQRVQFHFDGDAFEIQLIMTDPSSGSEVATFDGYTYSSDRIVDQYLTPCLTR